MFHGNDTSVSIMLTAQEELKPQYIRFIGKICYFNFMKISNDVSFVWVIDCTVDVSEPGLLTDCHVLFQSGMLTFQITSLSIQWDPRRRMRTLMIGQKVRDKKIKRERKKETHQAEQFMIDEWWNMSLVTHALSGLCWITVWNWFSCYSCLAESNKSDCQICTKDNHLLLKSVKGKSSEVFNSWWMEVY